MKAIKLNLETSYKINGNSTGCGIDTLAIAVDGRDSNDIENWEGQDEAVRYTLDHWNYESEMLQGATKTQLREWLRNPEAQEIALKEYENKRREAVLTDNDYDSPLGIAVQKARDDQANADYKEWLYGDYHGRWNGIIHMAQKKYGDGVDFTTKQGNVYVTVSDEQIKEWHNDGEIVKPTIKDAVTALESWINEQALTQYNKRQAEREKRRIENERLKEYKAKQAEEEELKRKEKIKKLLKNK